MSVRDTKGNRLDSSCKHHDKSGNKCSKQTNSQGKQEILSCQMIRSALDKK